MPEGSSQGLQKVLRQDRRLEQQSKEIEIVNNSNNSNNPNNCNKKSDRLAFKK